MGTNRTQPFGYRMEFGKVVIDPDEARWVVYMYEQYILGESFRSLADTLCGTGIRYDSDKQWNKNMVARILQDRRYTGESQYPQIIDASIFQRVEERRSKKVSANQASKAQKLLRRKCRCRITPHVEHEVLYLLNTLLGKPDLITVPTLHQRMDSRLQALQDELSSLMEILPVNENRARQKLMEVTVAMYEAIDPREYETHRMKKVFNGVQPQTELDMDLIGQNISEVMVDSKGKVSIRLKNDQIIERRGCNE